MTRIHHEVAPNHFGTLKSHHNGLFPYFFCCYFFPHVLLFTEVLLDMAFFYKKDIQSWSCLTSALKYSFVFLSHILSYLIITDLSFPGN